MPPKVISVIPILNRYHAVRYIALRARMPDTNCIETAGKGPDIDPGWRSTIDRQKHGVRVLFPDKHYSDVSSLARRDAVRKALDNVGARNIDAVMVLGWVFDETKAALAWAKTTNKAVVLTSDSTLTDRHRNWYREYVKKKLLHLFDAALVSGTRAKEYVIQLGIPREQVFTGFDVIDNVHFSVLKRLVPRLGPLGLARGYFLTVARLIPEKNLSAAMNAYATYCADVGPRYRQWIICGDGPLKSELKHQRASLGLHQKVIFAGNIGYDEIPAFYTHAGAFWLPSISETWGLAVNEAMCSRLPLLLSKNVGSITDLLMEGKNGWSFDPTSTEDMRRVLHDMHCLSESQRSTMGAASASIISQWSPERFADNAIRAIEAALLSAAKGSHKTGFISQLLLHF